MLSQQYQGQCRSIKTTSSQMGRRSSCRETTTMVHPGMCRNTRLQTHIIDIHHTAVPSSRSKRSCMLLSFTILLLQPLPLHVIPVARPHHTITYMSVFVDPSSRRISLLAPSMAFTITFTKAPKIVGNSFLCTFAMWKPSIQNTIQSSLLVNILLCPYSPAVPCFLSS